MRWFRPDEYRCRCGRSTCEAPMELAGVMQSRLDALREVYGQPIVLTSGLRCSTWNTHVGGVKNSAHLSGEAVDIACGEGMTRRVLVQLAMAAADKDGTWWFPLVEVSKSHIHIETVPRPNPLLVLE